MSQFEKTHEVDRSKLVRLETASQTPDELEAVRAIDEMIGMYKVPILTQDILIKDGATPHSHPLLTLNSRERPAELWLEVFSHEQMHWFFDMDPDKRDAFVQFARREYEDLGDCNTQLNPISFWEHVCVIWNTVSIVRSQLEEQHVQWVFGGPHRGYPLTHKLVFDQYDKIGSELGGFGLAYDLVDLR